MFLIVIQKQHLFLRKCYGHVEKNVFIRWQLVYLYWVDPDMKTKHFFFILCEELTRSCKIGKTFSFISWVEIAIFIVKVYGLEMMSSFALTFLSCIVATSFPNVSQNLHRVEILGPRVCRQLVSSTGSQQLWIWNFWKKCGVSKERLAAGCFAFRGIYFPLPYITKCWSGALFLYVAEIGPLQEEFRFH